MRCQDAYLLPLLNRQGLEDVTARNCACQLKGTADMEVLINRLVVVRGGSRVLAVDEEVVVHP